MNKIKIVIVLMWATFVCADRPKKIVGLVQVRNEAALIKQCVQALSLYTDAIVVLDDASDDATVTICKDLAAQYKIATIVHNSCSAWEQGLESDNRQKLLEAGRAIGGTHFIVIDADEMLSANCAQNNLLRRLILQLNPGDMLKMPIVHAWKNFDCYRIYFNEVMKYFIFCDDGRCSYESEFLHVIRVPHNLQGGAQLEFNNKAYALIHFGYVNWSNVLLKQAWYRCLERVRNPSKSAHEINWWYPCHKEEHEPTTPLPHNWLAYDFFDQAPFLQPDFWRLHKIQQWFAIYGKAYFAELDIWHIDWSLFDHG